MATTTTKASHDIDSTISYLARDPLWREEKPYIADFAVPEGAALSNQIITKCAVTIHDLRDSSFVPTLAENGFCLITASSQLTAAQALENTRECEEKYFAEITATMYAHFPEYKRFECIDLTVRQRDATFPWEGEVKLIKHEQPAAVAHTDYSLAGALMELAAVYPGQEKYFEDKRFDILNVWRPLKGPNDDWPLALCDAATIANDDIRDSDVIHYNRIGENALLHQSEHHRWYYLSGQATDECFIFRNVGSDPGSKRAFHAAFDNPKSGGKGRVSAEVRVLAFY